MSEEPFRYRTASGLEVARRTERLNPVDAIEPLVDVLDSRRGVLLTSTYEYPGRYTRWDMAFVDPALVVEAWDRAVRVTALNARGQVLLLAFNSRLETLENRGLIAGVDASADSTSLSINKWTQSFTEEQRSRQPSVFSILRELIELFGSPEDDHLGLYGSFGYDLAFQFDPVEHKLSRSGEQRDLVLYVPDELIIVDHKREIAEKFTYDFSLGDRTSIGTERVAGKSVPYAIRSEVERSCDHGPGEYAATVALAKEYFARGDLFEVVPGQTFRESSSAPPSELFRRLRRRNPAPYGALMNLGQDEYLVAASPEMYVRVEGRRVETCPISGTIARGEDVLHDADQILELLNSEKDASELTMCTDVDRNDKSRICEPESIRVIGRRQIEMYSRLIHTVDHVEGTLRAEFDALDAFLAHAWAVTVTGAPKLWAMRFIEANEKSLRKWYGGAIGALLFNGNANTGLTLRTIHVQDGVASVRAGATLLVDSDPLAEELETRTKASALLDAIRHADPRVSDAAAVELGIGAGLRILLLDHEDSFVHTLAGYLRRTGAEVTTVRIPVGSKLAKDAITDAAPDLVVISPGPGKPSDFHLSETLALALQDNRPVFGVCLGLQGIVEHFGGELSVLDAPAHGRASEVNVSSGRLFEGLPAHFKAGRYHSLYARDDRLPASLLITARTDDGVIMAIEHDSLPVAAVQFHPESMMTMKGELGMRLIENVIRKLAKPQD